VKFGTFYNTGYYGTDPGNLAAVAQHAEGCGFESFYVAEHIVLYPGAKAGPVEFPADLAFADPLECLSFIAARTERIVLGTGVLLLPYHHPVVLAKRLATIDVLSAGRMRLLTVGLGGLPGEAHAVGADEAIEVLHLLWAGGKEGVSFTGEHFLSRICAASPSPTAPARCQSTSADRAGRRPAAPARRRLLPRRQAHRRRTRGATRYHAGRRHRGGQRAGRAGIHPLGVDRHDPRRRPGSFRQRRDPSGRLPCLH
jgi:alkanesulfonate monooxygenase SsuD/methylene tetrahydromethanopterin reductase-like flavin-dependent oxidoreductase (luciferase family)